MSAGFEVDCDFELSVVIEMNINPINGWLIPRCC